MEIKKDIRAKIKGRNGTLSPEYKTSSDNAILNALIASDFYRNAQSVFMYIGLEHEIGTRTLLLKALADGKTVSAPKIRDKTTMDARVIEEEYRLEPGTYGLLEPISDCPMIEPEEIDLVVAPCLSCDPFGNRLGYGAGYYDRYLKRIPRAQTVRKGATFIALCRETLFSMRLPVNENDVAMDGYVTELGLFSV
jgi:5-formyltetrahydrofolate cyclo-ligase